MMIKPGISELSRRVDSRYTLVTMAAKRARMLGGKGTDDPDQIAKPVSEAVNEIADGKVGYVRHTGTESINYTDVDFYTDVTDEKENVVLETEEAEEPEKNIFMYESVNMPAYERSHQEEKKELGE